MKSVFRSTLCNLYKYSGAMTLREYLDRLTGRSFISILLFHRVNDQIPEDGLTVGTRFFDGLCRMLKARFRVVPLSEAMALLRSGGSLPARTVAITFDDCYRDNLDAARKLTDHGLPACFFVPTDYVGTDRVCPWDHHLPRLPNLDWENLREMVRLGHEIGSHSVTHPDMASLSAEEAYRELVESKEAIADRVGVPPRWFAFPFGAQANCPAEHLSALLCKAGYEASFSACGGLIDREQQYPVWPRQPVPDFRNLVHLELFLTGSLRWVHMLKRKMGVI